MKSDISTLAIVACFFIVAGCGSQPPKAFSDKKIIIASMQTVKIKEVDLSITNNGCGRKWMGDAERPFCDILIKWKDSTINAGSDLKPVYLGNIEVTIDKVNPWGREEDSVPPGGCRVWVRKLEGR